jgi:hypothetical protein
MKRSIANYFAPAPEVELSLLDWVKTNIDNSSVFVDRVDTKRISAEQLLAMNVNHFVKLGLDSAGAKALNDELRRRSFAAHCPTGLKRTRPNSIKVSIIGTAGRRGTGTKRCQMDAELFSRMCVEVERTIETDLGLSKKDVVLVSGGAAWAGGCLLSEILHELLSHVLEGDFTCTDCRSRRGEAVSER